MGQPQFRSQTHYAQSEAVEPNRQSGPARSRPPRRRPRARPKPTGELEGGLASAAPGAFNRCTARQPPAPIATVADAIPVLRQGAGPRCPASRRARVHLESRGRSSSRWRAATPPPRSRSHDHNWGQAWSPPSGHRRSQRRDRASTARPQRNQLERNGRAPGSEQPRQGLFVVAAASSRQCHHQTPGAAASAHPLDAGATRPSMEKLAAPD